MSDQKSGDDGERTLITKDRMRRKGPTLAKAARMGLPTSKTERG
jgi:hypothetical protein